MTPHSEEVRELGIHKVEGNAMMDLNPSEVALPTVTSRPDQTSRFLPRNHQETVDVIVSAFSSPGPSPALMAALPIVAPT